MSRSLWWRHRSTWPAAGSRTWNTAVLGTAGCAGKSPFEGGHHHCHYPTPHHSMASGQTTGREHNPTHQQKIGLKIYWAWPHPSEQDLDSHTASPSHQEASTSLLSLSTSRHGPQSCLTQWNYEPGPIGPPKMGGSWWRVLTKHGPLEKEMANHFSILTLRTPWTVWKCKKEDIERWCSQVHRYPICCWRRVKK